MNKSDTKNYTKQQTKKRDEIRSEFKWNIEKMYPSDSQFEKDISDVLSSGKAFSKFKNHILDSSESLLEAIEEYLSILLKLEHAFVYAHMKHDEDNANGQYSELNDKALSAMANVSSMLSFFNPEILSSPEEIILSYITENDKLKQYEFFLKQIIQEKAHVLSPEQEQILAQLGEVLNAPDEIFTMLNNADLCFGETLDNEGNYITITHGNYVTLMESPNRDIRENTYTSLYSEYKKLNNTISTIYNYNVKQDALLAKLKNYDSSLDAALSSDKIPRSVYTNLIAAVHKSLPAMHKYVDLRKRALNISELHMYDIYTPLVKPTDASYTFEEAVDTATKALSPLGDEYVNTLKNGLTKERWVDIYENKGKTSGAYSFGSYDSMPYILMNFNGDIKDVFTLVHEGGHSMHSFYTRRVQPFVYGSHSIFTAEVASTVNETLLINYLLKNATDDNFKAYLINFYIDEFKSTLFRQTMFAEFELLTHEAVEDNKSLTPDFLNSEYDKLNTQYFGESLSHDDYIQYEWSRIPHFYRAFYVYQYATGYSAANAIATKILSGDEKARDNYLKFLESGDSDYPIELLKLAGVNMSTEEPILTALSTFEELVDKLENYL